jgi:hypothetical protein
MFNHRSTSIHQLAVRMWRVAEDEFRRLALLDAAVFRVDGAWLDALGGRELVRGLHIFCPSPSERRERRAVLGIPLVVAQRMAKRCVLKYPRRMGTLWNRRQKDWCDPLGPEPLQDEGADASAAKLLPLKRIRSRPTPASRYTTWGSSRKASKKATDATPGAGARAELHTPTIQPMSMATPVRSGKIHPTTPLSPPKNRAKHFAGMEVCDESKSQQAISILEDLPRISI